MSETLVDLAVNVAANIIAALIIGSVAVLSLSRYRSRGLKRFFGFSPDHSELKIYLSTIAVNKGGTTATAQISEGFHGDAMTEVEYRHALAFASRITHNSASWILTTVLGARAGTDQVLSVITQSPSFRQNARGPGDEVRYDEHEAENRLHAKSCVVLIGGPIYNLLTHHWMRRRPSGTGPPRFFEFIREADEDGTQRRGLRTLAGVEVEDHLRTETATSLRDYFIVQKTTTADNTVFVCAGTCTAATAAAIDKLRDWRHFERRFGGDDFGVLYRIHLPVSDCDPQSRESSPDETTGIMQVREFSRPVRTGRRAGR